MQNNWLNKSFDNYRILPSVLLVVFMFMAGLLTYFTHLQKNKENTEKYESLESLSNPETDKPNNQVRILTVSFAISSLFILKGLRSKFSKETNTKGKDKVIRNITGHKLVENKISELNDHNRMILESVGEGIVELSMEGKIKYINKAGAVMIGYTAAELIGKNSHNYFHHKKPDNTKQPPGECPLINTIASGARVSVTEDHFVNKNGSFIPVEYTTNPIIKDGQLKGCVLVYRDISDRQEAGKQIILAKEIAEESSRLKSAILMNMSHELRTPLNGILGFAHLLNRKMEGTPEATMIDRIIMSGDRLLSTLNNILELAQLEAEQSPVILNQNSLKEIIPQLTSKYKPLAEKKNLFFIDNVKNNYMIRAESIMLMEALGHIIDNAIKFTSSGGVNISADQVEKNGDLYTRIHIQDTGIGIPKEEAKTIFMEFHQLSQGYKRQYEGTGIGLSLVYKMIVLMKGDINLESKPGKGSTFTVTLPSGTASAGGDMNESISYSIIQEALIPDTVEAKSILVVEDNYTNAELVKAYLEDLIKLDHAPDGKTALKMAVKKKYDIVLMDINLGPGMDGLDTTFRMRSIPGYKQTPIVAVTGYTLASDREKILKQGCDYFISKPFNQEKLKSLINEIVSKSVS